MEIIRGFNLVESAVGPCTPSCLRTIAALWYCPTRNGDESQVIIDFMLSAKGQHTYGPPFTHVARLAFRGTIGISAIGLGAYPTTLPSIVFDDISDRNWEGRSISVEDYEDGRLKILANEVVVLWVKDAADYWELILNVVP